MIKILQKGFFPILVLIVLAMAIVLADEIVDEKEDLVIGHAGYGEIVSIGINTTYTQPQTYYSSSNAQYREDVIVYFKEMPVSMDEFSSFYGVRPLFVKDDIMMAAFETSSVKNPGVTSQKTCIFIENMLKDPRVESVKEDTYMFINKNDVIKTTPTMVDIKALSRNGTTYVSDQVIVGFWKLPPSLDDFGAKYGGTPVSVSESDLESQSILFEAKDVNGFINGALTDPYVNYVNVNIIGRVI